MPRHHKFSLATFDNRLMDGLTFCRKVYALHAQYRAEPSIKPKFCVYTVFEKKLLEELIPLARYVQARYREGRQIRIRWKDGNQPYDAIFLSSGSYVENGCVSRKMLVEVTVAEHAKEYLAREELSKTGATFGANDIERNKKTHGIISKAFGHLNNSRQVRLAKQICESIERKSLKGYPPDTALIVCCKSTALLILEEEWQETVEHVKARKLPLVFKEVFLTLPNQCYSATLFRNS